MLITARNLGLFVGALVLLGGAASLLPPAIVIVLLLFGAGYAYWQVLRRDRQGAEASPALTLGVFLLLFAVMAYARSLADQTGLQVRYDYVIDGDRFLAAGSVPGVWLQQHLHTPGHVNLLDAACSLVYFSYFTVPFLAGVALWHLNPRGLRLYLAATIVIIAVANLTFTLLPTAPPWLAGMDGHLPALARIAPEVANMVRPGFYDRGYQAVGVNDIAAFPSLHIAQTLTVALVAMRYNRRLGALATAYTFAMGFSLVYLGEHYLTDVLAGALLALAGWVVALRITPASTKPEAPQRHSEERADLLHAA